VLPIQQVSRKFITWLHFNWECALGQAFFIGMMAAGYFYNVTFIQLGLTDLGRRMVGMSQPRVAGGMALLALLALVTALVFGYALQKSGRSTRFLLKLRIAFGVVAVQTLLTLAAGWVTTETAFFAWVTAAALVLGVGMPVTFSLTVDLVPRRNRGLVAGLVTAGAYVASNVFSDATWQMQHFQQVALMIMAPGALVLGLTLLFRPPLLATLAGQHRQPAFRLGRFVREDPRTGNVRIQRNLPALLALMFGVFFIDSLGFLRLLDTPVYMQTAWQSADPNIHLFLAATHIVSALIGGILYSSLSERHLFAWIFGIFAITHLQYTFHARIGPADYAPLAMPMLYAIAVSLYTVVNFSIWADISTPQTISFHAAIGVALSGWSATFLSTALGIGLNARGLTLEQHLRLVDALAVLFFLALLLQLYFHKRTPASARAKD
jgi:MFS family permease